MKKPTPADVARGERIRKAREAMGIGQAEMGRRAGGTAPTTAMRWEKGTSPPTGERLERLAAVLGVTPDYIMSGEEGEKPRPIPPGLQELFDDRPDLQKAMDPAIVDELLAVFARNAVKPKTKLDWQRLVEPIVDMRPSTTHEEKRRKRRPE